MNLKLSPSVRKASPLLLLAVAAYVALIAVWGVGVQYPEGGLDPSWAQALVDATDQRRVFGSEMVFTYGPLHQSLTGQVSKDWTAFLLGKVLFSIGWFVVVLLAGRLYGLKLVLGIALAVSLAPLTEIHFYLLALLGVVLGLRVHTETPAAGAAGTWLAGTLACACTLLPLAKLSFVGAAVPSLLVLVGLPVLKVLLRQEQFSLRVGALFLTPPLLLALVWGITVNWSPRSLLEFFLGANLDIVKGYSSAMSLAPSELDWTLVGIFLLLSLHCLGWFWQLHVRGTPRAQASFFGVSLLAWVALLAFCMLFWVVFKGTFVRRDPSHTSAATFWGLEALIILLALPSARLLALVSGLSRVKAAVLLLTPFVLGALLLLSADQRPSVGWIKDRFAGSIGNLRLFTAFGRQAAELPRAAALARIRETGERFEIPAGASADIVPWEVSEVLADGLRYTPRPIPQSYAVYTRRLQTLNRDFALLSPDRPEYYIVGLGHLDDYLPIGLDSPLLLNLRHGYEFDHRGSKGALVFKRKAGPAESVVRIETLATGSLRWAVREGATRWSSSPIELPHPAGAALVLQATFRDGFVRSALAKLYRPFPVQIEYLDQTGKVIERARFISDAVEEMLIYPLARTNDDLLGILYPDKLSPKPSVAPRPSAVRFSVKDFAAPFAVSEFRLLAYHFSPAP